MLEASRGPVRGLSGHGPLRQPARVEQRAACVVPAHEAASPRGWRARSARSASPRWRCAGGEPAAATAGAATGRVRPCECGQGGCGERRSRMTRATALECARQTEAKQEMRLQLTRDASSSAQTAAQAASRAAHAARSRGPVEAWFAAQEASQQHIEDAATVDFGSKIFCSLLQFAHGRARRLGRNFGSSEGLLPHLADQCCSI